MPCGKYLVVMPSRGCRFRPPPVIWIVPFATEAAVAELKAMSAATVDRYQTRPAS